MLAGIIVISRSKTIYFNLLRSYFLCTSIHYLFKINYKYSIMDDLFIAPQFPRSSRYHPEWIRAGVSGGANPLWMSEWLAQALDLRAGMRVLDLGCGRAMSSIFLHREFGVQVWAVDLMCSVSQNLQRIRDADVEQGVFPIHVDARALPFGLISLMLLLASIPSSIMVQMIYT